MECFRIDESGYTGFDLLNPEQRFQGAAAIAISNDDAARLIREHFPRLQAPELKYRSLSRRPGHRASLLALMRDTLSHYKCVTHVLDKRYLLIMKFLDYAVEPYYHKRNLNFYEGGYNYSTGSLLTLLGPQILGEAPLAAMLAAFQRAMKEKSPESLSDLVTAVRATRWKELPEVLGPLAKYAAPECLQAIATPGVTTDLALVVMIALISRMEAMTDGPYRVEHDQSKNLETYHGLMQQFIGHKDRVALRASKIAGITFPLKLTEVIQIDSKTSPAVQLADVMIGAALEVANTLVGHRSGGLAPDDILPLYAEHQIIHMLPDLDLAEQRRFRQGARGGDIIDFFAVHFGGKGGSV